MVGNAKQRIDAGDIITELEVFMGREITFEYPAGATHLDPDEADGLLAKHITIQSQLNEWEQINILQAERWISRQNFKTNEILTIDFVKKLHHKMLCNTWGWAGEFRKSDKNIGVHWLEIAVSIKNLMGDIEYQLAHHTYPGDELAARFHHRLVSIHPFANGNGRHARMMTDILLLSQGEKRFS
ncbi:MAG: mobile mystery protein B, partial [Gammaproteobacteria bacterium]|nr:mobile mystery protein B [Gammaproteobacteria bacterium]